MHDPVSLLVLLLSIVSAALVIWAGRRTGVSALLVVAWGTHTILWNVIPLTLQQFIKAPLENSVGPISRMQLSLLHASILLLLVLIHFAFRRPVVEPVVSFFNQFAPAPERLFEACALVLVLMIGVELRLSQVSGSSFNDIVAFTVTADSAQLAQSGLLSTVLGLLVGFSLAVISLGRREGVTRGALYLSWIAIAAYCGFSISRGSRSIVLFPAIAGLIAISALRGRARARATRWVVVFSVLTIVVGAPITAVMGLARGGLTTVSFDLVSDAYNVLFGTTSINQQIQTIVEEANRKYDAIGPGVELLAMEPPGSAGLTPFLSASASPIPRIMYQAKPVPTSRDGTYLGTPYYIAAKAYGDPSVGMIVPVSATAISLWEFGALGPLVMILMNIINLLVLNTVLLSRNVLARAIGISFLAFSNAEFLVGPPSSLLQNDLRLSLFIGMLAVALLAWDALAKQRGRVTVASS